MRNFLVSEDGLVVITDFGQSHQLKIENDVNFYTLKTPGDQPFWWCAPEVLRPWLENDTVIINDKTDIYMLGCTLVEILFTMGRKEEREVFVPFRRTKQGKDLLIYSKINEKIEKLIELKTQRFIGIPKRFDRNGFLKTAIFSCIHPVPEKRMSLFDLKKTISDAKSYGYRNSGFWDIFKPGKVVRQLSEDFMEVLEPEHDHSVDSSLYESCSESSSFVHEESLKINKLLPKDPRSLKLKKSRLEYISEVPMKLKRPMRPPPKVPVGIKMSFESTVKNTFKQKPTLPRKPPPAAVIRPTPPIPPKASFTSKPKSANSLSSLAGRPEVPNKPERNQALPVEPMKKPQITWVENKINIFFVDNLRFF